MGLISLVVTLIVIGVLLYLVDQAPFIAPPMKQIIRWVVIVVVVLWLLSLFVGDITIPTYRR
jgi:cation transporter-like permease